MVLIDYSGSVFAAIAVELNRNFGTQTDINFLRHIILKQLKSYQKKFEEDYGEIIVCLDSKHNWRKDVFPNYKFARKKARLDSGVDWNKIFSDVDTITKEFMTYLPYKFIKVDNLEADDIIAILTKEAENITEVGVLGDMKYNVLIVSNDKDYKQLHKFRYVKQYYPRIQLIAKDENPEFALLDLIVHGDKSDGIPNIRSDKNTFVDEKRQTAVSTAMMKRIVNEGTDCLTDFEKERFLENEVLISFDKIPSKYVQDVLNEYNKERKGFNRFELFQYFARNGMKEMIDNIEDF